MGVVYDTKIFTANLTFYFIFHTSIFLLVVYNVNGTKKVQNIVIVA